MQSAVSYAYERASSARPTLYDQFAACRAYAEAQRYHIVGEYNDIDTPSHPNEGAGFAMILRMLADDPTTVVLIYQPDQDVVDQLAAHQAKVEPVTTLAERAAGR